VISFTVIDIYGISGRKAVWSPNYDVLPDFPCRDAMLTALRPDSELETVRNGLLLEGFQFYFIRHFLFERLSSSYKG
jgi:hypothetical protein